MREPRRKLCDYVRGRWSSVPPERPGVYRMRCADGHAWVAFWDGDAWSPSSVARPTQAIEFFYLRGDADGEPTRWDDERVAEIAEANGWRARSAMSVGPKLS